MADWRTIMQVNLIGPALIARAFLPLLGAGSAGVFVASLAAYLTPPPPDRLRLMLDPLAPGLLDTLAASRVAPKTVQMIDSTVIPAHHQAAGAKGGLKPRVLAARAAASRAKFTPAPMAKVSRSASSSRRAKRTTRRPTMR